MVRAFIASVFGPVNSWVKVGSLLASGVVVLAGLAAPGSVVAQNAAGEAIFQQKCTACHTIGHGAGVGPDLQGVTSRRERGWLTRWLTAPDRMLAAKDTMAVALLREYKDIPMPNLGLSEVEVGSLLSYLGGSGVPGPSASNGSAAPPPVGDPMIGKTMFTGVTRLQKGGPPCMACHSIAGIGVLGGGVLGPDLTLVSKKYGDTGLASVLATTPFPTMNPIFSRHPLTREEQRHLRAFLLQPMAQRPARAVGRLAGLALLGGGALLGLMHISWRSRLGSVRRRLVGSRRLSD